mmetsp:Transcript_73980/g.130688  ORF Transcript_73980/g.130688 Transcript_73980/m.130688 type:complete len:212 (-) Transcript_73980:64-699(-)
MVYPSGKAFGGPDPLRRLPSSQSQGSLRRHGESSLRPSVLRNPESRPHSRPKVVPQVPLERCADHREEGKEAVEVLQIGCWSVRRPAQPDARPIFVNMNTGIAQEEPPEELLRELAADEAPMSRASFRRIVMGKHREMPLMMARDILAALRDDVSLFDQIQIRFSDTAEEAPMELDALPEDMVEVAQGLAPHELSDIVATESGMQMLLRVS